MATLLRMPEISANTVEAVLSEWPLAENTEFAAGDAIATVETEKAVVDVPADAAGVLLRTLVEPGKSVSVGTPMAVLGAPGETVDDIDALVEQLTGEPIATAAPAADEPTPAGTREVSQSAEPATAPAGTPASAATPAVTPNPAPANPASAPAPDPAWAPPASPASGSAVTSASAVTPGSGARSGLRPSPGADADASVSSAETTIGDGRSGLPARIFASPLARRIARENGLQVGDIDGTGPGGRIVRDDVRRVITERAATPPSMAANDSHGHGLSAVSSPGVTASDTTSPGGTVGDTSLAGVAANDTAPAGPQPGRPAAAIAGSPGYVDIAHTRMRRAIANRLTRSNQEAPVFSIRGSARVDELLALRKQVNEAAGVKVSVNDLIVAAAARAHVAVPEMNAVWTPDAVRRFDDVDISVAVATDSGLVTPVVRGVQKLSLSALAATSADLVSRARDGKLRQDELEGGSLTVTNLGVFGTEDFSAVINPPQAAILAVGAARQEPVVIDGALGIATVLRVTLSVDHRPVDGATAARWMATFLALVQTPLRILV